MAVWLWYFWIYSFLGYLLEKAFAAATRARHRRRKCFLLLPMCPVYGLGVTAVLALPPGLTGNFWSLALWGGLTATAVEYGVHLLYERLLGVAFWDYTGVPGNLRGRVCLPFSLAWSLLLPAALWVVQPAAEALATQIPPAVTYGFLLLFTADAVCSARFLQVTHDIDGLRAQI